MEIQVELEELEDAAEGEAEVFDLDPFDTIVGQEGEEEDDSQAGSDSESGDDFSDLSSEAGGDPDDDAPEAQEVQTDVHHVQDMVNKLDAILKNVFDHFSRAHPRPPLPMTPSELLSPTDSPTLSPNVTRPASPANVDQARSTRRTQFYVLLSIFERTILKTFKSRYTQFVIFWFSSLDAEFSDIFQGMLVSKALLEEDQPMVTRAAAASYIASFVSRAQFVDRDCTRRVMGCLCNFLGNRLDIFSAVVQSGSEARGLAHHGIFYAVSQAVFLIFCFRWRDLQQDEDELEELVATGAPPSKWMAELEVLRRVVQSELNPLKVRARPYDFVRCDTETLVGVLHQRGDAIRASRTRDGLPLLLLHHRSQQTFRFCTKPLSTKLSVAQLARGASPCRAANALGAEHILPVRSI